jgi:hypothetical protein
MSNFNEEVGSCSVRGVTKVVIACNHVDIYDTKHDLKDKAPTNAQGCQCLGYILMMPTLASHVARPAGGAPTHSTTTSSLTIKESMSTLNFKAFLTAIYPYLPG